MHKLHNAHVSPWKLILCSITKLSHFVAKFGDGSHCLEEEKSISHKIEEKLKDQAASSSNSRWIRFILFFQGSAFRPPQQPEEHISTPVARRACSTTWATGPVHVVKLTQRRVGANSSCQRPVQHPETCVSRRQVFSMASLVGLEFDKRLELTGAAAAGKREVQTDGRVDSIFLLV